MPSNSNQFPAQYRQIGPHTLQVERWELSFSTPAMANAFKTSWYAYVRLLYKEKRDWEAMIAVRVKARVEGSIVILEDRNKTEDAKRLDAIFSTDAGVNDA